METQYQNGFAKKKTIDSDKIAKYVLTGIASLTILVIFLIILFIIGNSTGAIREVGLWEFITGGTWKPSQGSYGAMPTIVGTILLTAGSIAIALPLGLGAAIYMSEVSRPGVRRILKPIVELFAGIPSIVYGFFGLVVLVPLLGDLFPGQMPTGFAWLTGSILLAIMALPTIVSVSEDALRAVPQSYREASLALGATSWETTRKVVVPAAISGISAAAMLGIGRAIGETMAVMMVTGNAAVVPEPLWNIFSYLRSITSTLALEMPEVVVGSTHYSALFLLALVLMVMVLAVNLVAKRIVKRTSRRNGSSDVPENPLIGGIADAIGAARMAMIKSLLVSGAVFTLVYMFASLFTGTWESLAVAAAVAVAGKLIQLNMGRISRVNRQKAAHTGLLVAVGVICTLLVVIIGDVVVKGLPAISWEFLTQFPKDAGRSGGIMPAIVGTLELLAGTALIALPLGIFSGVYLAEYATDNRVTRTIRNAVDMLSGTPSIVFGLFGLTALVIFLGFGYSLIAGCIALALMILPVIIRTTEEAVSAVPHDVREASLAMGATKWQTTTMVVLPAAFGGVITGVILALGRAAGETAPIMFTAAVVMQSRLTTSVFDPVMALPYHLYYLATEGTADPSMQYGTALVLLVIVLALFGTASVIRERSNNRNNR